ncbi:Hypothetical predicted protein [Lecanosticta acicola]|uniref:C2H2-type domain-containing protein n=1 Tax=Lecanosticta acicola TaxID=111012 RepID=A0AAI8YY38_9PEZI|nr:Hypothetical predicted protein [Lecanosticta acicola]
MNQYQPTNYASFAIPGFPSFASGPDAEFRVPEQPYNASHRASCPTALNASRSAQDEAFDLSQVDAVARRSANNVSMQDMIKPEESGPWDHTHPGNGFFQSRIPSQLSSWQIHNPYATSEPARKHDGISDAADSGYYSLPTATPTQQNFTWNKEELEQSFLSPIIPQDDTDARSTLSDARMISRSRDGRRKQLIGPCPVQGCKKQPKNLSDAKKHELTHTRPHRCDQQGCSRKDGFATDNDLQRHRKSVHNLQPTVGSTVGYTCVACNVPDGQRPKFWPRRDNFKAHIKRKHLNWNEELLIEKSKQAMRPGDACTADDDAQGVRTAMRSAAHFSQVDPEESRGCQQLSASPSMLERHVSEPGLYTSNNLWSTMTDPEDALAGMQGHTADLEYYTSPAEFHGNGSLSMIPDDMGNTHFATFPPPPKRLRTDRLHWSYSNDQEQQQQVPLSQFQVSEHSATTTSTSSSQSGNTMMTPTLSQTGTGTGAGTAGGIFQCRYCEKVKKRDCDLK